MIPIPAIAVVFARQSQAFLTLLGVVGVIFAHLLSVTWLATVFLFFEEAEIVRCKPAVDACFHVRLDYRSERHNLLLSSGLMRDKLTMAGGKVSDLLGSHKP